MAYKIKKSYDDLYENCLYSSIAHAVCNLKHPFFGYEQSWDGWNYSYYLGGTRGTISFYPEKKIYAGALRDDSVGAILSKYPEFKAIQLFEAASEDVKQLAAEEALMYLYDRFGDITTPAATAAFWGDASEMTLANASPDELIKCGGSYIMDLANKSLDEIRAFWDEGYELSEEDRGLTERFYRLKKEGHVDLRNMDLGLSAEVSDEGYKEFVSSLRELGFTINDRKKKGFFEAWRAKRANKK